MLLKILLINFDKMEKVKYSRWYIKVKTNLKEDIKNLRKTIYNICKYIKL